MAHHFPRHPWFRQAYSNSRRCLSLVAWAHGMRHRYLKNSEMEMKKIGGKIYPNKLTNKKRSLSARHHLGQQVTLSTIFTRISRGRTETKGLRVGLSIRGEKLPPYCITPNVDGKDTFWRIDGNEHEINFAFQIANKGRPGIPRFQDSDWPNPLNPSVAFCRTPEIVWP